MTAGPNAKYFSTARHSLFTGARSFSGWRFSPLKHLCISLAAQRYFPVSITVICTSAMALLYCQYEANKNTGQPPVWKWKKSYTLHLKINYNPWLTSHDFSANTLPNSWFLTCEHTAGKATRCLSAVPPLTKAWSQSCGIFDTRLQGVLEAVCRPRLVLRVTLYQFTHLS